MSLNVNINPLNFREMRLREPQGERQFGEAIDAWKRGAARRRAERIEDERLANEKAERDFKREQDEALADMLDPSSLTMKFSGLKRKSPTLKTKPGTLNSDRAQIRGFRSPGISPTCRWCKDGR